MSIKINLLRTAGFGKETFEKVVNILSAPDVNDSFKVAIHEKEIPDYFKTHRDYCRDTFENRVNDLPLSIRSYIHHIDRLRTDRNIPKQDYVVLLSPPLIDCNWWICSDPGNDYNLFISPSYKDDFIGSDTTFIIAQYIITRPLLLKCFGSTLEIIAHAHREPKGCIMDYATNREELSNKLRPSQFCQECWQNFTKANSNNYQLLAQTRILLDHLRSQIEAQRKKVQDLPMGKIIVNKANYSIAIPAYQIEDVDLSPLEKAFYILHLLHPEGIERANMGTYGEELWHIYRRIHNHEEDKKAMNIITNLLDISSNSYHERMANIKRYFISKMGNELAEKYYIKGDRGKAKFTTASSDWA